VSECWGKATTKTSGCAALAAACFP
jgi:hypothetical protein